MSGTPLSPGEPMPPADALRDEVAHLREAMRSQRDIGQAWRTMLRVSQDSNTKVRTVARVLVATHNGAATPEDRAVLAGFVEHLPASGGPRGPRTGDDPPR